MGRFEATMFEMTKLVIVADTCCSLVTRRVRRNELRCAAVRAGKFRTIHVLMLMTICRDIPASERLHHKQHAGNHREAAKKVEILQTSAGSDVIAIVICSRKGS